MKEEVDVGQVEQGEGVVKEEVAGLAGLVVEAKQSEVLNLESVIDLDEKEEAVEESVVLEDQ